MAAVRLQKFLAEAGVASRRASELLITTGQVKVNGKVVRELGTKVDPLHDEVFADGRVVKVLRKHYIALHKPAGWICSKDDPEQRRTVHDLLPQEWSNLFSVGRLDFKSEGLIFLTNDGDFCLRVTHPRYGVVKKYQVSIGKQLDHSLMHTLTKGVYSEGERLAAKKARLVTSNPGFSLIELELTEGKNREIRRMFEALGLPIDRLVRVQIGGVKLAELPEGRWRTLRESEIKGFMNP